MWSFRGTAVVFKAGALSTRWGVVRDKTKTTRKAQFAKGLVSQLRIGALS